MSEFIAYRRFHYFIITDLFNISLSFSVYPSLPFFNYFPFNFGFSITISTVEPLLYDHPQNHIGVVV